MKHIGRHGMLLGLLVRESGGVFPEAEVSGCIIALQVIHPADPAFNQAV